MLRLQHLHSSESVSKVGDILNLQLLQINPLMCANMESPTEEGRTQLSSLNSRRLMMKSSDDEHKSKEASAANKHALAERNRRRRINSHLNALRKLFPYLPKRDKPRVLTETVKYLKELKKKAADRLTQNGAGEEGYCIDGDGHHDGSSFLPGEKDEFRVSTCGDEAEGGKRLFMVKAMICCEDRPRLNGELTEAVKSVKGKVVKAEMATIGGRTKAVLVVEWCRDGGGTGDPEEVGSLRRALKAVVENRALGCSNFLGSDWARLGSNSLGL